MNKYPNLMLGANIAGSGKDTVANYLVEEYGYYQIAFADPVYFIAKEYFGMKQKNRRILQEIGQKMRQINEQVWANYAIQRASKIKDQPIVISDMRQFNEFDVGLKNGFIPVRIYSDREVAIERMRQRDGQVDITILDGTMEDQTRGINMPQIENNGTKEELYANIDDFIKRLKRD